MCLFHNCLLSNSGLNPVVRSVGASNNKILPVTNALKRFQESIAGSLIQLTSWNHPGCAQMPKNFSGERQHLSASRLFLTFRKRELLIKGKDRSRESNSL